MEPILHGSFEHFPPDQLLSFFHTWRRSGALDIACGGERRARVIFEDGAVIFVESSTSGSPEDLLADLFTWPGGTFTFSTPVPLAATTPRVPIDLDAAIKEGRERAEEWHSLFANEEVMLRVNEDQPNISLTSDEFRVLIKVGGGRTIADLRADLKRHPAELYPVIHKLVKAKLLHVEGSKTSEAPVAAREESVAPREERVAPSPASKIGSLTFSNGGVFPLLDDVYVIGRDPRSDVSLDDGSVSSQHAKLVRTEQGFTIEDVSSRNGTFVNSMRVTQPRLLADADVIRIGKVKLTYNVAIPISARDRTIG